MWRVLLASLLLVAAPMLVSDQAQATADPECVHAFPMNGLHTYTPPVTAKAVIGGQIPSGGMSDFWNLSLLPAGEVLTPVFSQSGFGADEFTVRLYYLDGDACEEVAPTHLPESQYPRWVLPERGHYVVEVASPPAHGGSYDLVVLGTPA